MPRRRRPPQSSRFELPYPPSVNRYWRRSARGGISRTHISDEGRKYREKASLLVRAAGEPTRLQGALSLTALVHPPDRRRRDLDNVLKALLDALQHGGVYEDDSQIAELWVRRLEVEQPGRVEVYVSEVGNGW